MADLSKIKEGLTAVRETSVVVIKTRERRVFRRQASEAWNKESGGDGEEKEKKGSGSVAHMDGFTRG